MWPVREDRLPGTAGCAGVGVRRFGGESRGTYEAAPTYCSYHPGDARRAATAIAEGRVDIPPVWRTDTPEGPAGGARSRLRWRLTCGAALAMLLFFPGMSFYAVASGT